MADPIVVTRLIKERSELAGLADAKRGELNALLRDLDHLDAVIKLFAPERVPELIPVKRRSATLEETHLTCHVRHHPNASANASDPALTYEVLGSPRS